MAAAGARTRLWLRGLHGRIIPLDAKLGKVLSQGLALAGASVVVLWRHTSPLVRVARSPGQPPSTRTKLPVTRTTVGDNWIRLVSAADGAGARPTEAKTDYLATTAPTRLEGGGPLPVITATGRRHTLSMSPRRPAKVSRLIHEARNLNLPVEPASGTSETPSSAGPFFSRGDSVTEPRDLTDLVPADVRTELAAVIAALELHGPAVTKALQRLDQATTAAWNAVNPVNPTEDEWRLVERAVGIERGWNAAYQLVSTLDPPGQGRSPT
jgi:hypothetical protein